LESRTRLYNRQQRLHKMPFLRGQFDRTTAIDTDFINCLFYGTEVELSGFGAVRFSSKQDNPDSPVITDGTVTAFESAVITNCVEPPAPGVLDFGGPQNEVKFTNVVFESCRFRGFIRPEWFASCSFNRCIFPKTLALAQIEKAGNSLTESTQLEENAPDCSLGRLEIPLVGCFARRWYQGRQRERWRRP
jgi:hypothetical protein